MLGDLVPAGDTQVDPAFADEGRDVGGGEEDEGDGVVLDEGDVEAGFAAELYVRAGEEVEGGLLESSLWSAGREWGIPGGRRRCSLLGTAKRRRPSRLCLESASVPFMGHRQERREIWTFVSTDWLTRSIAAQVLRLFFC